jgi:hypothetical protein
MHLLVYLGILLFSSLAGRAVARFLQASQKPPLPGPFQAPDIPSGQSIPVLYGGFRLPGITTWFGQAKLVEVDVGQNLLQKLLNQSPQTIEYQWKVTMQQVYCWGPVLALRNMVFADRLSLADQPIAPHGPIITIGDTTLVQQIGGQAPFDGQPFGYNMIVYGGGRGIWELVLPVLYGGPGRGGGFTAVNGDTNNPFGGRLRFYAGSLQNGPDEVMTQFLGAGNVPSYGDLCHMVFDDVNVGESSQPPAIDVIAYREPKYWQSGGGSVEVNRRTIAGLAWNWIASDLSGAAIIYDLLVNPMYGKGENAATMTGGIGVSNGLSGSFEDANRALGIEGLGVSLVFSGTPTDCDSAIQTVLQHIDGVLRRNPVTQMRELKLIRNEAATDVLYNALRSFGESSIQDVVNWGRPEWEDTINAVTVRFSNAEKLYQVDTVTLRNQANYLMTGSRRGTTIDFLGITDQKLAWKVCHRELKKLSLRLWRGQLKMDRSAWDVCEGDVLKINYARYNISGMVVRVLAVDRGEEANGLITLDAMQDVFSFDDIAFTREPGVVPLGFATIIRPTITSIVQSTAGGVGSVTITLADPEVRVYEVAYRTVTGGADPSAWTVVASASPNTGDPLFPYHAPVVNADLSGDYTFTVPLSGAGDSGIEWRISYVAFGTAALPFSANGVIDNSVAFSQPSQFNTETILSGVNPIVWDVTGKSNDSASASISGNRSLVIVGAVNGFRGRLLITSTNATGNVLTLPDGSIIDGGGSTVTLGLKDQLSVYYDGTYFWWEHVTSSNTLPGVPLAASISSTATLTATLADMRASLAATGTAAGDLST